MKKFFWAVCAALALHMPVIQAQAAPVYIATAAVVDNSAEAVGRMNDITTIVESSVTSIGGGFNRYTYSGSTAFGANQNLRVMSLSAIEPLTVTQLFIQLDPSVLEEHITQMSTPGVVNNHNLGVFTAYGILFDVNFTAGFDISFVSGAPGEGNFFMKGVDADGNETYAYNSTLEDVMSPFADPATFGRIYGAIAPPPERTEIPEPGTMALALGPFAFLFFNAMMRRRKLVVVKA